MTHIKYWWSSFLFLYIVKSFFIFEFSHSNIYLIRFRNFYLCVSRPNKRCCRTNYNKKFFYFGFFIFITISLFRRICFGGIHTKTHIWCTILMVALQYCIRHWNSLGLRRKWVGLCKSGSPKADDGHNGDPLAEPNPCPCQHRLCPIVKMLFWRLRLRQGWTSLSSLYENIHNM